MIVETILRDREAFFAEIRNRIGLSHKNLAMLMSSIIFLSMYGLVMGFSHGLLQAASSAIKLPFLFIVTLMICTPSLHFFNLFFGSRQTLGQTMALVLTAMTTTSVILVSFSPVTFFFLTTTGEYMFFKLLNVAFFGIAGVMGIYFLRQGIRAMESGEEEVDILDEEDELKQKPSINTVKEDDGKQTRSLIFMVWVILYGFVGTQMAWTLRPFVGYPETEFVLFRQIGGNFYSDVFTSLGSLLGMP